MNTQGFALFEGLHTLYFSVGEESSDGDVHRVTHTIGLQGADDIETEAQLTIEWDATHVASRVAEHEARVAGVRPLLYGERTAVSVWSEDTTFGRPKAKVVAAMPNVDDLKQLVAWVDEGRLRPTIEEVISLPDLPAALTRHGEGHSHAKTVVRIADIPPVNKEPSRAGEGQIAPKEAATG